VDEVLSTGYLAEAEAAFQRGEVEDYFLFPAGKLKGGSVPLGRATAHASYQAMRDLFEDLEGIAAWSTDAGAPSTVCAGRRPTLLPSSPRMRGC